MSKESKKQDLSEALGLNDARFKKLAGCVQHIVQESSTFSDIIFNVQKVKLKDITELERLTIMFMCVRAVEKMSHMHDMMGALKAVMGSVAKVVVTHEQEGPATEEKPTILQ